MASDYDQCQKNKPKSKHITTTTKTQGTSEEAGGNLSRDSPLQRGLWKEDVDAQCGGLNENGLTYLNA